MAETLEVAQKLYNEGKWQEAIIIIDDALPDLRAPENIAEAFRIKGWSYYYLAIKGSETEKEKNLQRSKDAYNAALEKTKDKGKRISVANGLPLTLWILGEAEKVAAWMISDRAVKEFPDEPSVWNTRAILCRWAKDFKTSVEVCEKVYETALARRDYRTAGHGKQNRGDAFKELGRVEDARIDYAAAIGLYKDFEKETGQSAAFHIEGARKKLGSL